MAHFCAKCGEALPEEACFCPNCGTKVPESSDPSIRIRQDENGGLIFDVPEGTTVTISDAKPDH